MCAQVHCLQYGINFVTLEFGQGRPDRDVDMHPPLFGKYCPDAERRPARKRCGKNMTAKGRFQKVRKLPFSGMCLGFAIAPEDVKQVLSKLRMKCMCGEEMQRNDAHARKIMFMSI